MWLVFGGMEQAGSAKEKGEKQKVFFHGNVMIGSALLL
jgi:hypothetical protein